MFADQISQLSRYQKVHPLLAQAAQWLQKNQAELDQLPVGRIDIAGNDLFVLVQSYETQPAPAKKWESHDRYADIQIVVKGQEQLGWAPAGTAAVTEPYNAEKDITFFGQPAINTPVNLGSGEFAFFFPGELHQPGVQPTVPAESQVVRKLVLKVRW